jgi:hypothetical protein
MRGAQLAAFLAGVARRAGALLALLAAMPAAPACELPGGPARTIQGASHTVLYRTAPLKVGEHFAVDFAVCPAPDAVRVDAWMPEHRHGMNYRPSVSVQGHGLYRAEGLMLHMAGRWELIFEVHSSSQTERLTATLQLE